MTFSHFMLIVFCSPRYGWFDCPHPKSQSCSISSASSSGQNYTFNMLNNYTLYVNATVKWCGSQITNYSINLNETGKSMTSENW